LNGSAVGDVFLFLIFLLDMRGLSDVEHVE
jgi:hypothetical protein